MAVTIKTAQFGRDTCPQAVFTVEFVSETGGEAKYKWTLSWTTHGYTVTSSASKAYSASIDGKTVASGNFAIGGKTTQVIDSGEVTITKDTASRSVPIGLSFAMTFTWSGVSGGTKTASGSFNIAAKTSYTVSYNANGGSGAPSAQTKWYGTNLTLSSGKPSRTGHNFVRWNTNTSNTGTAYSPGGTYTANAAATLYAIWTPHTYTVQYNANGGTGAPGNQTKTYGTNLTLTTAKPTRTNYNFKGWSTSASGGVVYASGATYTANSAVTLYAVWELAYVKPRITNFNAFRCDANGNASETGIYIKATFNWATDKTVSGVYVQYKGQQAGTWISTGNYSNASTSGSVSSIMGGSGYVDTETSYHVRAYVTDSGGTTYSSTISIGTVKFPIDVKAGGTGVAIGKVSEKNAFEVDMDMYYKGNYIPNIFYNKYLGTGINLNDITTPGQYGIYGSNTNSPTSSIAVLEVVKYSADWIVQRITTIDSYPLVYERCYYSGTTWGNWAKHPKYDSGGSLTADAHLIAGWSVKANNGYLHSTANGNTVQIGSQNASWCHIYNSANIPFYFNKDICINGAYVAKIMASSITSNATAGNKSYIQLGNLLICWGVVSITPVANTATSASVTFPKSFSMAPMIQVSAQSSAPGVHVTGVGFSSPTATGCSVWVTRINTTATYISWVAIGNAA